MDKLVSKLVIDGVPFEIKDNYAREQLETVGAVDYDMQATYTSGDESLTLDIVKQQTRGVSK